MGLCGSKAGESLRLAAFGGDVEGVRRLVASHPSSVHTTDKEILRTALHQAASQGHADCVDVLLRAGSDAELRDKLGNTALCCAAWEGHADALRVLLSARVALDTPGKDGYAALALAAMGGHAACVEQLLAAGAPLESAGKEMRRALHLAAYGGHADAAERLVRAGADVNATAKGATALWLAAYHNHGALVESLLRAGATVVCADDRNAWTPLHALFAWSKPDANTAHTLSVLLAAGTPVHQLDTTGATALHLAARSGQVGAVRTLLAQAGVREHINAQDREGATPLHYAAVEGHAEVACVLGVAGADGTIANARGEQPAAAAIKYGHQATMGTHAGRSMTEVLLIIAAGRAADLVDE